MDATAGIAMMRRQGLGGAKHIATQFLWVQDRLRAKDIEMNKIGTAEKLADLMIKPLAVAPINGLLTHMGFIVQVALKFWFIDDLQPTYLEKSWRSGF